MTARALVAGCAPQVVVAVDFAAMAVAAPDLREALELEPAALPWVFSAYSLAFGALLAAGGAAADAFGARRLLLAGTVLFLLFTAEARLAFRED